MAAVRNIRTWADIVKAREDEDLSAAEDALIKACQNGGACVLGDGTVPMEPNAARNIGADLLRYLITGGCDKANLHEQGVTLVGAYIGDQLDIDMCVARGKTRLRNCYFKHRFDAEETRFQILSLNGSHFPNGIRVQGAKVQGGAFLNGITSKGTIQINSADFGGGLELDDAKLLQEEGNALNAQGISVTGAVSMENIQARSTIILTGAKVQSDIDFEGASFEGKGELALRLDRLHAGSLVWRGIPRCDGCVTLSAAHIENIMDDAQSWQKVRKLILDRFTYGHLYAPHTVQERLDWLAKDKATTGEFRPQPYQQLAKVYGDMGHDAERRRVLLEKERLTDVQAREDFEENLEAARDEAQNADDPKNCMEAKNKVRKLHKDFILRRFVRGALRRFVGYGYAPQYLFLWGLGAIAFIWLLSCLAMVSGGMVPNSDIVMTSKEWRRALDAVNPTLAWLENAKAGQHYETFQSFAYAVDVVVPLVPLEQEVNWTPTTQTPLGTVLWVSNWFAKAFGWVLTGLGAATITGHVRRD